jgi:hypothetical protein
MKGGTLRQKDLAVTDVVSDTLTIEAFVTDIHPLVTAIADGPSCIIIAGDAR